MKKTELIFKTGEQRLKLKGAKGSLEAAIVCPESFDPKTAALVCHPHPLFGGSMQNKVVTTTVKAFKEAGICSLRFNFRGVGDSEGEHDNGVGETDDTIILLNLLKASGFNRIFLTGFSFGAYISLKASLKFAPVALIAIAPPVTSLDPAAFQSMGFPWVIIQPENDEVLSSEALYDWVAKIHPSPKLIRFKETGHYFHGQLVALKKTILTIIETVKDQSP